MPPPWPPWRDDGAPPPDDDETFDGDGPGGAVAVQLPSNVATPGSPLSPKLADIKLIQYDFAKYGTTSERKRLLERWDREVGSIVK